MQGAEWTGCEMRQDDQSIKADITRTSGRSIWMDISKQGDGIRGAGVVAGEQSSGGRSKARLFRGGSRDRLCRNGSRGCYLGSVPKICSSGIGWGGKEHLSENGSREQQSVWLGRERHG